MVCTGAWAQNQYSKLTGSGTEGTMTLSELTNEVATNGSATIALGILSNTASSYGTTDGPNYFFSADNDKVKTLQDKNVFTIELVEGQTDKYTLKTQAGAYIASGSNNAAITTTTSVASAAQFTLSTVTPGDYAPKYASADKVRFTQNSTFLNCQERGANSAWKTGTGGYSAYVIWKIQVTVPSANTWSVTTSPSSMGGIVVNSATKANGSSFEFDGTPVENTDFTVVNVPGYNASANVGDHNVTVTYTYAEAFTGNGIYTFHNNNWTDCVMYETDSYQARGRNPQSTTSEKWQVTSVNNDGNAPYYIRNLNTGRYLNLVAQNNTDWFDKISGEKNEKAQFYFKYSATNGGFYSLSTTSGDDNTQTCAHMGSNQDRIVCWNNGVNSGGSRWQVIPVSENYDVYEVVVNGASGTVTMSGVTPAGKTTLGNGEAFFVTAGTTVSADNFTAAELTGYTKELTFSGNTVTVTYTAEPTTADAYLGDWYNFKIGGGGFIISYPGDNQSISLTKTTSSNDDADLWRRVGNDTDGWRIYNKAAGFNKVLAAPTNTADGNTGGSTFPIVVDKNNIPSGYTDLWEFTSSSSVTPEDGTPYFMNEKGYTSNKVNIRSSKLAFWNGGADAGSTVWFAWAQVVEKVDLTRGTLSGGQSSFHGTWTSTKSDPTHTYLRSNANNMQASGNNLDIRSGQAQSATYTFAGDNGYFVKGYAFDATRIGANDQTVTIDGTPTVVSTTSTPIEKTGLTSEDAAQFTLTGANTGMLIENVYVTVEKVQAPQKESFDVFPYRPGDICSRIPAITTTQSGKVIAAADYRYGGADIGYGSVDLRCRISNDNGETWGDIAMVTTSHDSGAYASSPKPKYDAAYGDPCLVADRTSQRAMMMSCSGNTGFPDGTRQVHQGITRFYSTDDGATWSEPVNLESQFYGLFDNNCSRGPIRSMFIGSGRIMQSHYIKKGDYYRLYCVGLVKDVNGANVNYVFYSDDFGGTWNILGDKNVPPITSGDEPKAEELPGGSVICSSRIGGGRRFNIFTFSDMDNDEGTWGTEAVSNSSNNGCYGANCNGEIMLVPVVRKSDSKKAFLAIQSIPAADTRRNVSMYYKFLDSFDKYDTPAHFAENWQRKQVSSINSAYSTMTLQNDNTIGFLYEEETYGLDYNIVYKNYSIEELTDDVYEFEVGHDYTKDVMPLSLVTTTPAQGTVESITALTLTFNNALTLLQSNVELATDITATATVNKNVLTLTLNTPITENGAYALTVPAGVVKDAADETNEAVALNYAISNYDQTQAYLLYNEHFTTYAIYSNSTENVWGAGMTGDAGHAIADANSSCANAVNPNDANSAWMLVTVDGQTYLYNVGADKFVVTGNPTVFTETVTPINVTNLASGAFAFNSTSGNTNFMCVSPQLGGKPICNWTSDDAGSAWVLVPCDVTCDYDELVEKIRDGKPIVNRFYRLKNNAGGSWKYASNNKYSETGNDSRLAMVSEANDATIWLYTEDLHLIGYTTGLGTKNTYSQAPMGEADPVVFEKSATDGKFYIKRNDNNTTIGRYWFADREGRVSGSINAVNRNSAPSAGGECDWEVEEVTELPALPLTKIGDVRYATLYLPVTATVTGAEVYLAETATSNKMRMEKAEDGVVPAFGGVVIVGTNASASVTITGDETEHTSLLTGSLVLRNVEDNELVFTKKTGTEKVGFYKLPTSITTVKQFRALYDASEMATAAFDLDFEGTTGIASLINAKNENAYDLQGRKVNNMKRGNIYIKNGKAVLK